MIDRCREAMNDAIERKDHAKLIELDNNNGHLGGHTWGEYDARGLYLCRVCDECVEARLSVYRKDVLENPSYECDEPIEPEEY